MVGRFVGSFVMQKIAPERVLTVFAFGALLVVAIAPSPRADGDVGADRGGPVPLDHVPDHLHPRHRGLGPLTEEGSGLMIMAIAGGALVVVQGWLADHYGLQNSFFLTMACEVVVLAYALWGSKPANIFPDDTAA